ncbi:biotin/lipoyl-containing protein [Pedobacter sp. NJ-S-72]
MEGINWGMNTHVRIGVNKSDSDLYSIQKLIKERKPEISIDGSQVDQLFGYSHYLMTYAADILEGETNFFDRQEALIKQEKENAWKASQAESIRKISEGYLEIDTPFGEPVWRKSRPLLSTYSSIRDKFPYSFEVIVNEEDLLSSEQYDAVITNWKVELNEIVKKDEVICEISTDKVCVEIVAPQTGRLVWLLEEGIVFKFSSCIALLDL